MPYTPSATRRHCKTPPKPPRSSLGKCPSTGSAPGTGKTGGPSSRPGTGLSDALKKAHGCITLTEIEYSSIDRIYVIGDLAELGFLKDKAPDTPKWEEALEMGEGETVVLGNLGAYSTLFLVVDPVDVMSIQHALCRSDHLCDVGDTTE